MITVVAAGGKHCEPDAFGTEEGEGNNDCAGDVSAVGKAADTAAGIVGCTGSPLVSSAGPDGRTSGAICRPAVSAIGKWIGA